MAPSTLKKNSTGRHHRQKLQSKFSSNNDKLGYKRSSFVTMFDSPVSSRHSRKSLSSLDSSSSGQSLESLERDIYLEESQSEQIFNHLKNFSFPSRNHVQVKPMDSTLSSATSCDIDDPPVKIAYLEMCRRNSAVCPKQQLPFNTLNDNNPNPLNEPLEFNNTIKRKVRHRKSQAISFSEPMKLQILQSNRDFIIEENDSLKVKDWPSYDSLHLSLIHI